MFESEFSYENIPAHVIEESIDESLGDCNLTGSGSIYNFRCPICGDSQKNTNKKRGYVREYDGNTWMYICHNQCGTMPYLKFLQDYRSDIYQKVIFHGYTQTDKKRKKTPIKKIINTESPFKSGELVEVFNDSDIAQKALAYCISRKIPESIYSQWYVCLKDEKFKSFDEKGNKIYNSKGMHMGNEYSNRLIIPYYKLGGKWKQFDARSLEKDAFLRYRNLNDCDRELYNIDWLDVSKPFFLLEGSINSVFVKNSVAFGGTKHLMKFLTQYPELKRNASNGTIIWDNDEAGQLELQKTISLGFNWFDWSELEVRYDDMYSEDGNLRVLNDINDLVRFSDDIELDVDGFIKTDSIIKYIKKAEIGVRTILMHGNIVKKVKERNQLTMENMKLERMKKDKRHTIFNFGE